MPYNSSAFEKQLAKHKAEQAAKAIADLPDQKYRSQSRATASPKSGNQSLGQQTTRSTIKTQAMEQALREPERKPLVRADQMLEADGDTIVIIKRKRPLYLRGWFIMLVFSVLSTALSPIIFKEQWAHFRSMAQNVKETTGIDPLSAQTYTDLAKGKLSAPSITAVTAPTTVQPLVAVPNASQASSTADVVNQAQERAQEVVRQGGGASMEYIEEETRRLNEMAKELDKRRSQ